MYIVAFILKCYKLVLNVSRHKVLDGGVTIVGLEHWLWLANGLGFGAANSKEVLDSFSEDAVQIYEARESVLLEELITPAQSKRMEKTEPEEFHEAVLQNEMCGVQIICFNSSRYPTLLKEIISPPPVLYVKGDVELLNGHLMVSMVGARTPSVYGMEATRLLGGDVAKKGMVVVSGLAAGLDAEAHKAALAVNGATVACVAFGHGACYPANNRNLLEVIERNGAVVSEYPLNTKPEKTFFLQRNRIIAGISHALVVVEARKKSGTMSTVDFATEYGRDIFSVPGSVFSPLSEGTNILLQEGASVFSSAQDILDLYEGQLQDGMPPKAGGVSLLSFAPHAWQFKQSGSPSRKIKDNSVAKNQMQKELDEGIDEELETSLLLGENAKKILSSVGVHPQTMAEICEKSALGVGQVMAALTELELAGLVQQLAGRQFIIAQ